MHGRACIMSVHSPAAVPRVVAQKGALYSLAGELVQVAACVVAAVGLFSCMRASADRRKSATELGLGDASPARIMSLHATSADL